MTKSSRAVFAITFALLLVSSAVVAPLATATPTPTTESETATATESGTPAQTDAVEPIDGTLPRDNDGDGRYEDLNANGETDLADTVTYFQRRNDPVITDHVEAYDYNDNDKIELADVIAHFQDEIVPADPVNDADGDGLSDSREAELGTNASRNDSDGDGIADGVETNRGERVDTDGDGTIDALDADSDGDGVLDAREGTGDADGDGVPNYRDPDDDGDGIDSTVEVRDGRNASQDLDRDGTVNWLDTDSDGDGTPDGESGRSDADGDSVPAYLDNDRDNDGLPGFYERDVTGTDPATNDSSSNHTSANETGNGLLDGAEDFDGDGLTNVVEYRAGTEPFEADTDGDGLDDGYEHRQSWANATVADTDDDGVLDGAADEDDDGLTNAEEVDRGTVATLNDTDGDGLVDGDEVDNGPDPLLADSDDDGLDDAAEFELGTDPVDEDTDDDGILDGNATFTTNTSDAETGASVTVTGEGDAASGVTITNASSMGDADVGPTVHLQNETAFEEATVTLPVNETLAAEEPSNVTLYKWSGSGEDAWRPLETTVNETTGTASATVGSFSYVRAGLAAEPSPDLVVEPVEPVDIDQTDNFRCTGSCERNKSDLRLSPSNETIQPPSASDIGPDGPIGAAESINFNRSVTQTPSTPDDADHVVAANGSGNFTAIQPAINAAETGETIVVRNGTYHEQIIVNTTVTLVGQHATLDGSKLGETARDTTAIDIENGTTISGFAIHNYTTGVRSARDGIAIALSSIDLSNTRQGIDGRDSTTDWSISNTNINSSEYGIRGTGSSGNWSISTVNIQGDDGISAQVAEGDWSVSDTAVAGKSAGVDAYESGADWSISNVEIRASSTSINAYNTSGSWSLSRVSVLGNSRRTIMAAQSSGDWSIKRAITRGSSNSIFARATNGSWEITNVNIRSGSTAITASDSSGNWTVTNVAVPSSYSGINAGDSSGEWLISSTSINSDYGAINAGGTDGNWTISSVVIPSSGNGISGSGSSGDWSISHVAVRGENDGIDLGDSIGDWSISKVTISTEYFGINAERADGDLTVQSVNVSDGLFGISAHSMNGPLLVKNSTIRNISRSGVRLSDLEDSNADIGWAIHNSTLQGDLRAVDAEESNETIDATANWWGQQGGPTENQTRGPVQTSNPCSSPCPGGETGWDPDNEGISATISAGPGSTAAWNYPLGADRSQIVLNYTADGTSESAWVTISATTTNETQHWRVPIGDATTPVRERLNVTDVHGDATITMRAVNASVDVESVRVRRDDDGDGLWNHVEGQPLRPRAGPVENVSTRVENPDTDDDGVPDGDEIKVVPASESSIDAPPGSLVLDRVYSHPERADTDGDGLTDGQERHGWEIGVAPSPNASEAFLNRPDARTEADVYAVMYRLLYSDLKGNQASFEENISFGGGLEAESPDDLLSLIAARSELDVDQLRADHLGEQRPRQPEALVTRTVGSSPLESDTDGDGLSDEAEQYSGSDPGVDDTDGDGVDDAAELDDGQAPTLFDHRSPRVEVHSISSERGDLQIDDASGQTYVQFDYDVTLRATDQSGVRELRFRKGCQAAGENLTDPTTECPVRTVETYDGSTSTAVREVEFSVNRSLQRELQTFAFAGSPILESVNVTGEDVHGTSGSDDYASPGAVPEFVKRASETSLTNYYAEDVAKRHAVGSAAEQIGSIWGVRQGVADLRELLNNPEMVVTWVYYLDKLPQAITQAPDAIDALQDRHNPYDRDDQYYGTYRNHWIGGYAKGIVAFEAVTSRGAGSVKKAATVRSFRGADAAETVGDARNAAKLAGETAGRADVNPAPTRRALTEVSVQKRPELADALARQDWATIRAALPEDTDAPAEVLVGRALARTGSDGEDLLGHLASQGDEAAMRAFLASEDAATMQRTTVRASAENPDVTEADVATALRRYEELDVEPTVRRNLALKYAELDESEQTALTNLVEQTGDAGNRVLGEVDTRSLRRYLGASCAGAGRLAAPTLGTAGGATGQRLYSIQPSARPGSLASDSAGGTFEIGGASCPVDADFWNRLDSLDNGKGNALELVAETGEYGNDLVRRLDAEQLENLVGRDSWKRDLVELRSNSDINAEETEMLVRELNERGGHLVKGRYSLANNVDSVDSVKQTDITAPESGNSMSGLVVRATYTDPRVDKPIAVRMVYPDDSRALVENSIEDQGWTLESDGTVTGTGKSQTSEVQATIGEALDEDVIRARGERIPDGFTKDDANEGGVDLVARDENGEVVVETKYYSIGGLSDKPFGQARGAIQFSDSWVEGAIQEQVQRGDITLELRDELLTSPDRNLRGDVKKRVVFVQNQDSPTTTLTDSFIRMASQDDYGNVDEVTIVKAGRQITGVDS